MTRQERLIKIIDNLIHATYDSGYYAGILSDNILTSNQCIKYCELSEQAISDREQIKSLLIDSL